MYASSERLNEQANPCMSELYKSAEEIVRDHAHRVFEARSVDESLLERVALVWPPRHRLLATVLFTDIVDSIKQAAEIGDWKWGELLQQREVTVRRGVGAVPWPGGEHGGDAFLIAFDGSGWGIRRGLSIS